MQPLEIQNVIKELTRRVIALSDSRGGITPGIATESNSVQVAIVNDKVISTQQLNELPHGFTIIQVDGKSLITPAAADWLRERKIDVQRGDVQEIGEVHNLGSERNKWVCLVIESVKSDDLVDRFESFDCILKVSKRCMEAIDNGNRVILVADSVSAALISLNRNKKLRAIEVRHVHELRKNANQTYANIFVLSRESLPLTKLINQIQRVPENSGSPPHWL